MTSTQSDYLVLVIVTTVIVLFAGFLLHINDEIKKSRKEKKLLKQNENQKKIKQAEAKTQQARLVAVGAVIDDVCKKHERALVVQRRKLVSHDAYGNLISDAWRNELSYFRETVLEQVLYQKCDLKDLAELRAGLWVQLDEATRQFMSDRDGEDPVGQYFNGWLEEAVDERVVMLESSSARPALTSVEGMSPLEFEVVCAEQLIESGWAAKVVAGAGDQGVDIVAERDGITAVFQCKLYSSPLGNTPVQEIHTGRSFYDADIAAVVSNADYTKGARAAAAQTGVLLLHYSELVSFDDKGETS